MPSLSRSVRSSRSTCAIRRARAASSCSIASLFFRRHFVKVIPTEYERVLQIVADAERAGKTHAQAEELAFEIVTRGAAAPAPAACPACAMNQKEGR